MSLSIYNPYTDSERVLVSILPFKEVDDPYYVKDDGEIKVVKYGGNYIRDVRNRVIEEGQKIKELLESSVSPDEPVKSDYISDSLVYLIGELINSIPVEYFDDIDNATYATGGDYVDALNNFELMKDSMFMTFAEPYKNVYNNIGNKSSIKILNGGYTIGGDTDSEDAMKLLKIYIEKYLAFDNKMEQSESIPGLLKRLNGEEVVEEPTDTPLNVGGSNKFTEFTKKALNKMNPFKTTTTTTTIPQQPREIELQEIPTSTDPVFDGITPKKAVENLGMSLKEIPTSNQNTDPVFDGITPKMIVEHLGKFEEKLENKNLPVPPELHTLRNSMNVKKNKVEEAMKLCNSLKDMINNSNTSIRSIGGILKESFDVLEKKFDKRNIDTVQDTLSEAQSLKNLVQALSKMEDDTGEIAEGVARLCRLFAGIEDTSSD